MVSPKNSEELQKAILDCLNKSWDREAISKYSARFSWENNAEMIYHEMVNVLIESKSNA